MTTSEREQLVDKLNKHCDTSLFGGEDCVEWTGHTAKGYGDFYHGGCNIKCHRLVYGLYNGPITDGLHVLHSCDNPRCCNPAHLHLGTHQDNIREAVKRGRMANGQRHGRSKLTDENAVNIREVITDIERGKAGRIAKSLATLYNVSVRTIYNVASQTTYKHAI